MPSLTAVLARFTKQHILYWENTGDGPDGRPVFLDPVPLNVRWEDVQKEIILKDGRTVIAKGYLLLAVNVSVGSIVYLGPTIPSTAGSVIADWKATSSFPKQPTFQDGGREIIKINGTPDIKAQEYVYEAYI